MIAGVSSLKVEKVNDMHIQTVVFKDCDDDLIPVKVNFHSQVDLETDIRNCIEFMKSNDMQLYGLYPVINEDLSISKIIKDNQTLQIVFDEINDNKNNILDILESITYVITNNYDVETVNIVLGNQHHLVLTKDLGLNNFIETSVNLHQTLPVTVFKQKEVEQFSYYVPTSIRIDENESLWAQVKTILHYVDSKIELIDVSLQKGLLTVELGSYILLDNESIDPKLRDLIVLSLTSLKDVDEVKIKINDEEVEMKKANIQTYNYIKI